MFVRQNQQQFRNSNADVQIFYGSGAGESTTWNKPPGVSHVYIMCIGAGGAGSAGISTGGGSGAVTVWYGAAQNVPNVLEIMAPLTGSLSGVYINNGANLLVRGSSSTSPTAATATSANTFSASGFYQSTSGQAGSVGTQSASATTFLSGGSNQGVDANYGYSIPADKTGFFLLQPIIVGVGGSQAKVGGIGCGGGGQGGSGGQGMVLIASW
jgi:hypothetical protein